MSEVRRSTRLEKKKLAMAMREKQLGALGMEVGSSVACSRLSDGGGRQEKSSNPRERSFAVSIGSNFSACRVIFNSFSASLWRGYGLHKYV